MENENLNNIVVCNICGNENLAQSKFCEACGAKLGINERETTESLNEIKNESKDDPVAVKGDSQINQNSRKEKKHRVKNKQKKESKKVISNVSLFYIIFGLVIAGMIILYGSGTFSEPVIVANNQSNFDDLHKGVDLNKIREINRLEEELKNNPNDLDLTLKLGHMLNDSGFFEKAIAKYEIYLNEKPNDPDVLVDMGVCYFELKDYKTAIEKMEKAIVINPKHQIGHFNLGIVNLSANNREKAIDYWKKSIELDPNSRIAQRAKELLNNN